MLALCRAWDSLLPTAQSLLRSNLRQPRPGGRERPPLPLWSTLQAPSIKGNALLPTLPPQHLYVIGHSPVNTIPRDLSTETSSSSPRAAQHSHNRARPEMVTRRFPSEREEEHTVPRFPELGQPSANSFIQPFIHSEILTEHPPHPRHTVGEGPEQAWPFPPGAHRPGKDPWDRTRPITVAASLRTHPPPPTHTPRLAERGRALTGACRADLREPLQPPSGHRGWERTSLSIRDATRIKPLLEAVGTQSAILAIRSMQRG